MTENSPQINVRHLTTDPGNLENTRQDTCQSDTEAYNFQITENQIFVLNPDKTQREENIAPIENLHLTSQEPCI